MLEARPGNMIFIGNGDTATTPHSTSTMRQPEELQRRLAPTLLVPQLRQSHSGSESPKLCDQNAAIEYRQPRQVSMSA